MARFSIDGKFYGKTKPFNTAKGTKGFSFTVGEFNYYNRTVDYYKITAYGKTAELVERGYVDKETVSVHGKITFFRWKGEDGKPNDKIQFIAEDVFLSGMIMRKNLEGYKDEPGPQEPSKEGGEDDDEDLPF